MTIDQTAMTETALHHYDQDGEASLIEYLTEVAQTGSGHPEWMNSGVCLMKDGGAVIQDDDHYTFRWRSENGVLRTETREAKLPQEERRHSRFPKGPLYDWPDGETLFELILKMASAELQEITENATEEIGIDLPNLEEWEVSNMNEHRLLNLVPEPELGEAMEHEAPKDITSAGIDFDPIDDHMELMANRTLARLDEQTRDRLQKILALGMISSEGETEAAEALAQHWGMEAPE